MHERSTSCAPRWPRGLAGNAVARSGLVGETHVASRTPMPVLWAGLLAFACSGTGRCRGERIDGTGRRGAHRGCLGRTSRVSSSSASAPAPTTMPLVDSLFAAAGVGGVIAARASLSGAAHAARRRSVRLLRWRRLRPCNCLAHSGQAEHGASLALQGLLARVRTRLAAWSGAVRRAQCDRVSVALAGAELALAGVEFPIPSMR